MFCEVELVTLRLIPEGSIQFYEQGEFRMKNPLKAKLKAGEITVGIWATISHPDVSEVVAGAGFDWMVYDLEHSPYEVETAQELMQAASYNMDCIPLIRVAWNDVVMIKKALDVGAYGLIIPWVNTREEAENAVRYCMYPPKGVRGCGPRRPALNDPEYIQTVNEELLIGLQIETQTAVDNVEEIISVEGVDICFIGPNDLSLSLGIHRQFDHPKYREAIDRVLAACEKYGVAPGMYCTTQTINSSLAQGFRFCALGSEMRLLVKGMQDAFNDIKGWKPTPYKR